MVCFFQHFTIGSDHALVHFCNQAEYIAFEVIGCAANLAVQGGVKSAEGRAFLAFDFSVESAAAQCTAV